MSEDAERAFERTLVKIERVLIDAPWQRPLEKALRELRAREEPGSFWFEGPDNYDVLHTLNWAFEEAAWHWTISMAELLQSASKAFEVLDAFWTSEAVA